MAVKPGLWRTAALYALGALSGLCVTACECGPYEHLVRYLHVENSGSRVQGQSHYPELLDDPGSRSIDSNGPGWEDYHRFFSGPSEFAGEVYLGMGADLVPPWCEDSIGSADDFCASVFMDRLFVGPKREGEIYNVLHMDADLYVPGEPAIYVRWEEAPTYRDFCDFPEYHSTVASGTATVASEDPFTMTFAVEFQDDEDQFRLVTTTLTFTGYNEECRADN